MSKAKIAQSFSLATLFSAVALGFFAPLPVKAQSLRDCVAKYQRDYGISADEALRQCRQYGEVSPQENRGTCINTVTQALRQGAQLHNDAAEKAIDFCSRGGNSSCFVQSYAAFRQGAPLHNDAAEKAIKACLP